MTTYAIETRTSEELPTAVMFATLPVAEIGPWLAGAYASVADYLGRFGVGPVGMPFARYHQVDEDQGVFEVEAGFLASTPVAGEGDVEPSSLPAGEVAATVHVGPYDQMAPAYEAIAAWATEHNATLVGNAWEVYYSDPVAVPDPADWRTEIVQPYRPA